MIETACCFTGHRDLPASAEDLSQRLKSALLRLSANGYQDFYCGGALGFDLLAGEAVLEMAARYALPLRLHMVLPYNRMLQTASWSDIDQHRQARLLQAAASVMTLSAHYYRGCLQVRNRYLVDHSSYCLCYLAQKKGGTYTTVQYAHKKGLTVENLAEPE